MIALCVCVTVNSFVNHRDHLLGQLSIRLIFQIFDVEKSKLWNGLELSLIVQRFCVLVLLESIWLCVLCSLLSDSADFFSHVEVGRVLREARNQVVSFVLQLC